MIKQIILMIMMVVGVVGLMIIAFSFDFRDSNRCISSIYNPSNLTGGTYIFGKCYVPYYGTYESTEKCGFLGISCYETEPYVKMYTGSVCFRLKNGEAC